jgi:hypothetical protein
MVAYNFQARFATVVEGGAKTSTIRAIGKRRHARAGDCLQLYIGQRTISCRKLREAMCSAVRVIDIETDRIIVAGDVARLGVDAVYVEALAQQEGFADAEEMVAWFEATHGLPFSGLLIEWGEPWMGPAGGRPTSRA